MISWIIIGYVVAGILVSWGARTFDKSTGDNDTSPSFYFFAALLWPLSLLFISIMLLVTAFAFTSDKVAEKIAAAKTAKPKKEKINALDAKIKAKQEELNYICQRIVDLGHNLDKMKKDERNFTRSEETNFQLDK